MEKPKDESNEELKEASHEELKEQQIKKRISELHTGDQTTPDENFSHDGSNDSSREDPTMTDVQNVRERSNFDNSDQSDQASEIYQDTLETQDTSESQNSDKNYGKRPVIAQADDYDNEYDEQALEDDSTVALLRERSQDELIEIVKTLSIENEELRDKHLRSLADVENQRNRSQKMLAETKEYAVSGFARDLLEVADNLERAAQLINPSAASPQGGTEGSESDDNKHLPTEQENKHLPTEQENKHLPTEQEIKTLIEGVNLTLRELQRVLSRHGVEQISPQGAKFNPKYHQAVASIESSDVPSGNISQVYQHGYVIGERSLRPAMVVVSKGAAMGATIPSADNASDDGKVNGKVNGS